MREMKDFAFTLQIARRLVDSAMLCDDIPPSLLDKLCDVSEELGDLVKLFKERN